MGLKNTACYPARHASGGFALLSLVFLFKNKKVKFTVAIIVLMFGWSMGIYKMLIGDHFLSYTIVAMLIAWLEICIIALIVNSRFKFTRWW